MSWFYLRSGSWPGRPTASWSTTVVCCRRMGCPRCVAPSASGACLSRSRWRPSNSKAFWGSLWGWSCSVFWQGVKDSVGVKVVCQGAVLHGAGMLRA